MEALRNPGTSWRPGQKRTEELQKTNEKSEAEIAERRRTEEALKKMTQDLHVRARLKNELPRFYLFAPCSAAFRLKKSWAHVTIVPHRLATFLEITCARMKPETRNIRLENLWRLPEAN
jgi:hypothetical protein